MTVAGLTVLSSAFLLFQVQPLIAKWILPWFGGSPGVWTTCMVVFQLLLLGGYAYAHGLVARLDSRMQAWPHLGLLCLSLLLLPITPDAGWRPRGDEDPMLRILGLLGATIGLPFFLLSSTSPLLQAWTARIDRGRSPYGLYALSNTGSMLALVSYPTLVEPSLSARVQAAAWSVSYALFVLLSVACALRSVSATPLPAAPEIELALTPPSWSSKLLWTGLAACASTLLLAVTNQMCQDVAAIPFLWLLPLCVYLASFILCFHSERWYVRKLYLRALPFAVGALSYCVVGSTNVGLRTAIPVYSVGLFVCCMICHGELVRRKPAARHLTSFYLMSATGGALGGLFVGLAAPHLFGDYLELEIGILACVMLALGCGYGELRAELSPARARALRLALLAAGILLGAGLWLQAASVRVEARVVRRNFYGTLKVKDVADAAGKNRRRLLVHGVTCHGIQFLDPGRRRLATSYYSPASGAGLALRTHRPDSPRRVGLVGLGAGTLATYGKPGDVYRFYEINPAVVELARSEFTYLADSEAAIEVVLGDARLELEREPPQGFDVLAVDAFSSDSIPVHLLTREAFDLYVRHLKPDGVIAIHVTNQYLDFLPVVEAAARALGRRTLFVRNPLDDEVGAFAAEWILVTANGALLDRLAARGSDLATKRAEIVPLLWTDNYTNLFRILK